MLSQGGSLPAELTHTNEFSPEASSTRESRPAAARQPNIIVKHWRGDYSLAVSYWVFGFLFNVAFLLSLAAVAILVEELQLLSDGTNPKIFYIGVLLFFCLIPVITIWQLVGIWRSAGFHVQRGGKRFWAGLVQIFVVLGVLSNIGELNTKFNRDLISESAKLLVGIDDTTPYAIRILPGGTEMELSGGIPFGTNNAVRKFLDAAPTIKVIHLNSIGGRLNESHDLYNTIRERKLITYTSKVCASGCTIAFLAGQKRYISGNGKLGFHSASVGVSGKGANFDAANNDFRVLLRHHNVPDSFIKKAFATLQPDMWYPSKEELLAANIIDSVVDPDQFGLSDDRKWENVKKLSDDILESLESAKEKATPEKTATQILREEAKKDVEERLNKTNKNKHKLDYAAGTFFGSYFQNTKARADYCSALGVPIKSFVKEYKKLNMPVYLIAEKIFKKTRTDPEKMYESMRATLMPVLDQDMKDAASANNVTVRDVCMAFEEYSVEMSGEMDFKKQIPEAYKLLVSDSRSKS
jgi:hypothetical protein